MSQVFRTPEEIARELVRVTSFDIYWATHLLDHEADLFDCEGDAEIDAASLREVVARVIRQAIGNGLLPPPVSQEREADLRRAYAYGEQRSRDNGMNHNDAVNDLLALLDHARSQIRWLVQDDNKSVEAFEAGKRAGRLEGRKEVWECRLRGGPAGTKEGRCRA